ncbi:glycosyltransferase family 2 protein [Leifsonia shinshuensis]|uniref:glycosyltransferase family 2 protein n=1 Tax=Leifsonia shinshuensis TaxID=150026 RepID=UPI00285DE4B0|nr:glycosyltransferase family 2 protein [Leifsonia shinshuensis]MDR6971739.1 GT2 family glycosyltransferase [Leifsonia shinshuensis]
MPDPTPDAPAVTRGPAPVFAAEAVVVVNYGSSGLLAENLAALTRRAGGLLTVVVDSFSSDAERARIADLCEQEGWIAVLPPDNPGFGRGMNAGVERAAQAGAERVLLLNPDAEIAPEAVRALFDAVAASPLTLVAPRILRPDGTVWSAGSDVSLVDGRMTSARRRPQPPERRAEPWLSGACLCLSLALWERAGGFADGYFLYWEDVDLSFRVRNAGGALEVREDIVATHAEGGTQQAGAERAATAKSEAYYYFNIRNRMLFAALQLDDDDLRRWLRASPGVAREILLQGGRRQFVRPVVPLRAALRGLRDGRRIARAELRARAGRPRAAVPGGVDGRRDARIREGR